MMHLQRFYVDEMLYNHLNKTFRIRVDIALGKN